MPIGPAARPAGLSLSAEQTYGDFVERSGRKFRKTPDRVEQQTLYGLHSGYAFNLASPEASRPFAISILVALYLSGAALARAADMACSPHHPRHGLSLWGGC